MAHKQYSRLLLDQTKDLIWVVDSVLMLTYANEAFQSIMKQATGQEIKLNESVLVVEFGEDYVEKWTAYYKRALSGEQFEIEDHFPHPETDEMQYSQNIFTPIRDEDNQVMAVACQSRDITSIVKQRFDAHQLMDASLDVFCSINEAGNFVFVSKAATEHWGYAPHELIGKPYFSFVLDEDIPKTSDVANAILNGEEIKAFDNRYKRKDGSIAYNLWSARWDNEAKLMYCVARDAKEKIVQENLLLQSEQRFKSLVQEGDDMISIVDLEGRYKYTSPTTTAILGITPEEFQGRTIFDFIHPDDIERASSYMQQISTESKVIVEPFRLRNGNNEWRWIETVLTNMMDNPAVGGIVTNSRDITAKKEEEQRLKLLESVITNTNDAVLITEAEPLDAPGPRIIYVNDAFTRMTGYTAEEVIGKSPRILQGPKSDKVELARLSKALRNWEACEITTINYKKNGEEFWINFSVTPVADATGWYTHWISIERDVTEAKKIELSNHLTSAISSIFNEEPDLSSALSRLCNEVAVIGQFSFCEIWMTDIQENVIELKVSHKNDEAATVFYENSKLYTAFELGQGVPGKIWESNQTIIWDFSIKNSEFHPRSAAAEMAGIKTVVGFPLEYHGKFIGVLLFGTQAITKNVDWIIPVLEELGAFIGSELARKKTEIELTKIFDFAPDIIITVGLDGYIRSVNPYTSKLLGYTEKELTSKPFTHYIYQADGPLSAIELEKLAAGTPIHNFINRNLTKTGEIKTISWNCSPSIEDGLIFCIGKDITEEIKVRNLLTESNQISRIGSWEVDFANNSLFWSDITHEIHETPENFEPQISEAVNFYREDFRELVNESVNDCIVRGTSFDFEAIIVTSKSNEVWVRAMGRAEMLDGKCVRIFGSFQDINEKKLAELMLKSLANNIPGTIFQYQLFPDGTDKLLHLSKGAEKLYGIEAELAMQDSALIWDKIVAGGDIDKVKASINDSMISLDTWHVNFRSQLPNGQVKWLEGLGTPRRLSDGSTIWDSIVLDVTDLKETEAAQIMAEKNYRELFDKSNDAIYVHELDTGQISDVNFRATELTGFTKRDFLEQDPSILFTDNPQYSMEKALAYVHKAAQGKPQVFEWLSKMKDGTSSWFEMTLKRTSIAGVDKILAFQRDITDRKQAEREIKQANERFEKATEATNDVIWDWNIESGTFIRSNAIENFLGSKTSRMLEKNDFWKDEFHPEDLSRIQDSIEEAIANPSTNRWEMEYRVFNNEGKLLNVMDRGIIIRDNKGKATRMVGAMSDISERKQHEVELLTINEKLNIQTQELLRSNEELEQFAFITSHDLQEPLRMISSFMDQLKRKYADRLDEKGLQYIHFATDGAKRMKQIILDLLLYSRANKTSEQIELIDLNDIVTDYIQLRRNLIAEKSATLTFDVLPSFQTYRAPITQIFHCLLDNALKYVDEIKSPQIEIVSIEKEDVWHFAIKDNGIGIDRHFYDKIFIIFQRLQNRKEDDGTGIGLAIAKRSVEFLGGEIWVESEIGKGSIFYFTISKNKR